MFAHLYKPFYFPGEIVRGSIILDFFNDLPTTYKKVMLRLKGEEYVNKHHDKVKAALTKAQNIAKLNRSRSSIQTTSNIEGPKEIKETKIGSNFKQNVGKIAVGQTDSGMFQLKNNNGSMNVSEKNKSGMSGNNSSGV
jgi:hypothetical protein